MFAVWMGGEADMPEDTRSPWVWLAVVGCTLVAVLLRVAFVGDQSLGYEEVFTRSVVSHASLVGLWHGLEGTESTPPLYYLLTWGWVKLAGAQTAATLRATSLLAGSLVSPMAFLALRRFVGSHLALVGAWLAAVSPVLVGYSIYARSYSLLVLVTTLSVWALGSLLERQSRGRWALWGLAAVACLWTHYFAVFVVGAEIVALLVLLPRSRRSLLLCCGAIVAAVAPLWPLFHLQSSATSRTAFIVARPLGGRLEDMVRQFAMGTNVPSAPLEGLGVLLFVSATLFGMSQARRRGQVGVLVAVALIGAGAPVLAALTGLDDRLLARNVLGVWICVAAVAGLGLVRLRGAPLLAYSAVCIVTVVLVQSDWRYQAAPDWGGVSSRLAGKAAGEPVAIMPGQEVAVAALYLHRLALAGPVASRDLWVVLEPARGPGQRALSPVRDAPPATLWGPAFKPVAELDYRGFRMIHLRAESPTAVPPAAGVSAPGQPPSALVLAP